MSHIKPGFFVQIPNELLVYTVLGYSKDPDIRVTPTTLGVYLALYQHRHTSGGYMKDKACVSLMRLAIELGASKNTVAKHISILENVGLITVTRLRSGNIYSFNAPLSIEEFIDKYPDEYQIYKEKLDKLYNIKMKETLKNGLFILNSEIIKPAKYAEKQRTLKRTTWMGITGQLTDNLTLIMESLCVLIATKLSTVCMAMETIPPNNLLNGLMKTESLSKENNWPTNCIRS